MFSDSRSKSLRNSAKNFHVNTDDFKSIAGIGEEKALQIASTVSLVKGYCTDNQAKKTIITPLYNVTPMTFDLRETKEKYFVYLYLNSRNVLLKKEVLSIGIASIMLLHPRKIFYLATELNTTNLILLYRQLSDNLSSSEKDIRIFKDAVEVDKKMGISSVCFVLIYEQGDYRFDKQVKDRNKGFDYIMDEIQGTLFDELETEQSAHEISIQKATRFHSQPQESKSGYFQLQNRRYLGNKYKLLGFITDIISKKCGSINSLCDIFAGTGVVGERFNNPDIKIISNDFLFANYACLYAFLGTSKDLKKNIHEKIKHLNNSPSDKENYFSKHFGGTYFTKENARKIGSIREEIDRITKCETEKNILICSLIYAVDRVANTVGHYDAFRKKLDMLQPVKLLVPSIAYSHNINNEIYQEDANALVRKISCDVLYIDPPYNSRQYSDAYHLLENLAEWKKPDVVGVGKKMDRLHIKSNYCLKKAMSTFADLIRNANCKHILLSYNNTGDSKDGRSNARLSDNGILQILYAKGDVEVFEKNYKAFTTGKSNGKNNAERIFYCKVTE